MSKTPNEHKQTLAMIRARESGDEKVLSIFDRLNELAKKPKVRIDELVDEGKLTALGIRETVEGEIDEGVRELAAETLSLFEGRREFLNKTIETHTPPPPDKLDSARLGQMARAWEVLPKEEQQKVLHALHKPENAAFAEYLYSEDPRVSKVGDLVQQRAERILNGKYALELADIKARNAAAMQKQPAPPSEDPVKRAQARLEALDHMESLFVSRAEGIFDSVGEEMTALEKSQQQGTANEA